MLQLQPASPVAGCKPNCINLKSKHRNALNIIMQNQFQTAKQTELYSCSWTPCSRYNWECKTSLSTFNNNHGSGGESVLLPWKVAKHGQNMFSLLSWWWLITLMVSLTIVGIPLRLLPIVKYVTGQVCYNQFVMKKKMGTIISENDFLNLIFFLLIPLVTGLVQYNNL